MKGMFEILLRMSSVRRFSHRYMVKPEDLLQHNASVHLIVAKIVGDLRENGLLKRIGIENQDLLFLYEAINVHDIDEISMGDIPRPTKYTLSSLKDLLHKMEKIAMQALIKLYGLRKEWFDYWDNAKAGKVGIILVIADLMGVAYKYWEERLVLGNRVFDLVHDELRMYFYAIKKDMLELSETFCSKFALDPEEDGVREYLKFLVGYICEALDIIDTKEKDLKLRYEGEMLRNYNESSNK